MNPLGIPLLNTVLLLASGVTVTWVHRAVSFSVSRDVTLDKRFANGTGASSSGAVTGEKDAIFVPVNYYRRAVFQGLQLTILFGVLFLALQCYEYIQAGFTIADSVYGSLFFVITGFHGLHVLVGTLFLVVCYVRHIFYHFSRNHHVGLECAIWY